MPLLVGERVLVYGWVGCRYRGGIPGTIIRVWVTGVGEWIYSVILEAPEPDGVCLVEAASDDVVRAAPAAPVRPKRRRRAR